MFLPRRDDQNNQDPWSRRHFLGSAGAVFLSGAAFGLTGCGSDFDGSQVPLGTVPPGGGNGSTSNGAGSSGNANAPTGSFSGRVNLSEVGGTGLNIRSPYADPAVLSSSGAFSTTVSQTGTQLLLLLDDQQQVRAMSMTIPQVSGKLAGKINFADMGADSTAETTIFMVRGILTIDPTEALLRLGQIRDLATYPAYRDYLRGRLAASALNVFTSDAESQRLLTECVVEYRRRFKELGRIIEDVAASKSTGQLAVGYADKANPTPESQLNLSNEGWRYVSVYREELDADGNPLPPLTVPNLGGLGPAFLVNAPNLIPSASPISWGNILGAQVGSPTTVTDNLGLTNRPQVRKIRYYVYGPGSLLPENATFPADLQVGAEPIVATVVYQAVLPIMDFLLGTVESLKDAAKLTRDMILAARDAGFNGVGIKNAFEGGTYGSIVASVVDFLVGAATAILGVLALLAGGLLGAIATVLFEVAGAAAFFFGGVNLIITMESINRNPIRAKTEIDVPAGAEAYLASIGSTADFQVQDLSASGTIVYNRGTEGLFYKENLATPLQLLGLPGEALLNSQDQCLYRATDGSTPTLVYQTGEAARILPPPPGATISGLSGITTRGFVLGTATRSDQTSGYFTYTENGSRFLNVPSDFSENSLSVVGAGGTQYAGNALGPLVQDPEAPGRHDPQLVRVDAAQGTFSATSRYTTPYPFTFRNVAINDNDEILGYESTTVWENPKPAEMTWPDYIFFYDKGKGTYTAVSYIEGPGGGKSEFARSVSDSQGGGESHVAYDLNEDGEVIGTVSRAAGSVPTLWSRSGVASDIRTLLPSNAPAGGTWSPKKIAGRFLLLEHTLNGITTAYLFYRGEA